VTTIKPTQRDRDAAIQRARELGAQMAVLEEMRELIRAGRCDDGTAVQTALKALNAERAIGYRMGIEAAANAACNATIVVPLTSGAADGAQIGRRTITAAIRALSDNAEAIARGE
jgi:hypothetical protein